MESFEFQEDRTTYVKGQILETDEGTEAGKDISSGDWTVKFRMFRDEDESLDVDEAMTKIEISGGDYPDTSPAKSGFGGNVTPTFSGRARCRIVLVDGTTANAGTPSGYEEYVFKEWTVAVKPSVQP